MTEHIKNIFHYAHQTDNDNLFKLKFTDIYDYFSDFFFSANNLNHLFEIKCSVNNQKQKLKKKNTRSRTLI